MNFIWENYFTFELWWVPAESVCVFPLASCLGAWSIFYDFKLKFFCVFLGHISVMNSGPPNLCEDGCMVRNTPGRWFPLFPFYQYQGLFRQFLHRSLGQVFLYWVNPVKILPFRGLSFILCLIFSIPSNSGFRFCLLGLYITQTYNIAYQGWKIFIGQMLLHTLDSFILSYCSWSLRCFLLPSKLNQPLKTTY